MVSTCLRRVTYRYQRTCGAIVRLAKENEGLSELRDIARGYQTGNSFQETVVEHRCQAVVGAIMVQHYNRL